MLSSNDKLREELIQEREARVQSESECAKLKQSNESLLEQARLIVTELQQHDTQQITCMPDEHTQHTETAYGARPSLESVARHSIELAYTVRTPGADQRSQLRSLQSFHGQTLVIGICGISSSGKSTVAAKLKQIAWKERKKVPIEGLDSSYSSLMSASNPSDHTASWFHSQPTTMKVHVQHPEKHWERKQWRYWKNWESPSCVDWEHAVHRMREKIAIWSGLAPFIIVDGFLLLENEPVHKMLDVVINIKISKQTVWQRRLKRALDMAEKEATGQGEVTSMCACACMLVYRLIVSLNSQFENYEKLCFYAAEEDFAAIRVDAAALVAQVGVDVVFPTAEKSLTKTGRAGLKRLA